MSYSRKRIMQTKRRAARKRVRTPKQSAQDARYWACGRKVIYPTLAEAEAVAERYQMTAYACRFREGHFHVGHTREAEQQ